MRPRYCSSPLTELPEGWWGRGGPGQPRQPRATAGVTGALEMHSAQGGAAHPLRCPTAPRVSTPFLSSACMLLLRGWQLPLQLVPHACRGRARLTHAATIARSPVLYPRSWQRVSRAVEHAGAACCGVGLQEDRAPCGHECGRSCRCCTPQAPQDLLSSIALGAAGLRQLVLKSGATSQRRPPTSALLERHCAESTPTAVRLLRRSGLDRICAWHFRMHGREIQVVMTYPPRTGDTDEAVEDLYDACTIDLQHGLQGTGA